MKFLVVLSLSLFSLNLIADEHSCSHKLRNKVKKQMLGGTVFCATPVFLAGICLFTDAYLLNKEANRLKAAHILTYPKNYPESEILKAKKIIAKFYAKLVDHYPSTLIVIEEFIAALEDVYNKSAPFCKLILKSQIDEPILTHVFKNGELGLFNEWKCLKGQRTRQRAEAALLRDSKNVNSSLLH